MIPESEHGGKEPLKDENVQVEKGWAVRRLPWPERPSLLLSPPWLPTLRTQANPWVWLCRSLTSPTPTFPLPHQQPFPRPARVFPASLALHRCSFCLEWASLGCPHPPRLPGRLVITPSPCCIPAS